MCSQRVAREAETQSTCTARAPSGGSATLVGGEHLGRSQCMAQTEARDPVRGTESRSMAASLASVVGKCERHVASTCANVACVLGVVAIDVGC